jgi:hypothetical protein
MRKVVKVERVTEKEKKDYLCRDGATEIVDDLFANEPFMSSAGKTKYARKRRAVIADLTTSDRLIKLSKKQGARASVCRELVEKGRISREEYKKYNAWGDIRFIREFVEEEVVEGNTFYVLKKNIAEEIKGKGE